MQSDRDQSVWLAALAFCKKALAEN